MDKLIPLAAAPKGVNQRAEETDLPEGSVRSAVNVTLDAAGKPKRRAGYSKVASLSDAHSLWAGDTLMLGVTQGALCSIDPVSGATTVLHAGAGLAPVSYAVVNDWLYYTSELISGRLNLHNPTQRYPYWGMPQPGGVGLSVGAGGLAPGQYQVTCTYVSATGEESGAEPPAVIYLSATGGITVSLPTDSRAAKIHVYCSMINDTVLYRQATVAVGTATYTITRLVRGRECTTVFLEPLPSGRIVRYYRGRVYVASGNVVYYSNALHYGLYEPDNGYLPPFPSDVTMIEPVEDGLYIGADRTYFIAGTDPAEFQPRVVDPGAPIFGSSLVLPGQYVGDGQPGYVAYWYDNNGPAFGAPGGTVQHIGLQALTGATAASAASGLMRDGGVDRIVTALADSSDRSLLGASDSAEITIIRNGSVV